MRLVRWRPRTGMPVYNDYLGLKRWEMDLENFDWTPRINVEELEDKSPA